MTLIIRIPFSTKTKIKEAICKNEFLQNFDDADIDAFVLAMYPKDIPPNTRIIQEGDIGKQTVRKNIVVFTACTKKFKDCFCHII